MSRSCREQRGTRYLRPAQPITMAQDAQAQLNRRRKARTKLEKLRTEAAEGKAPKAAGKKTAKKA
jgi:hypothetical protein